MSPTPTRSFIAATLGVAVAIGSASLFSSLSVNVTMYAETETKTKMPSFENATISNVSFSTAYDNESRPTSSATPTFVTENKESLSPSSSSHQIPSATSTVTSTATSTTVKSTQIPTTLSASMGFEGRTVPECCCSFCELEQANRDIVYPLLKKVVETPFFSHFKIDLCSSCELWEDAPLCRMKDCSVCECEAPPEWSLNVPELPPTGPDPYVNENENDCDGVADDNVVTAVNSEVVDGWETSTNNNLAFGSSGLSFLLDGNDDDDSESASGVGSSGAQVVDLLKNPEGYTGYTGPSAEKVWSAIHSQNCFQVPAPSNIDENKEEIKAEIKGETSNNSKDKDNEDDKYCFLSPEQRLYNRFISGLHSSISLHIAHSYCLEMDPHNVGECRLWGPNDDMAYDRVLSHPDRVENLYVAFSLLLRAVVKAEFAIAAAVPASDPVLEDSLSYWQESLLPELLALPEKAPLSFDESVLLNTNNSNLDSYSNDDLKRKRTELQRRFRELQSIVQCVGCDRCKLWGTLQTLGVGTALRILYHDPGRSDSIHLTRQEAVALVNTLERLSSSLVFAQEFRTRREERRELYLFDLDREDLDASCQNGK